METLLLALYGAGPAVSYNATSMKLELKGGTDVQFQYATTSTNQAAEVIGVTPNANTTVTSGSAFPNTVSLRPVTSIGIQIPAASIFCYNTSSGTSTGKARQGSVLLPVPSTSDSADNIPNIISTFTEDEQFLDFKSHVKKFKVRLVYPSTGAALSLNGADWEMYIQSIYGSPVAKARKRARVNGK
jgi:hypothetical protein